MTKILYGGILFLTVSLLLTSCTRGNEGLPDQTPIVRSTPVNGFGYTLLVNEQIMGVTRSEDGNWHLTAVSLENGNILWKSEEVWGNQYRPVLASDGIHLFGDAGNSLQVYLLNGAKVASVPHPGGPGSNLFGAKPILEGNKLFIPNGYHLYAYDVSNPEEPMLLWQNEQPKKFNSVAVDERGDVYAVLNAGYSVNYRGNVLKLSGVDGRELWRTDTYDSTIETLDVGYYMEIISDRLLVEAGSRYITYDLQTGQKLWISDPLICDDAGYQGAYSFLLEDGTIYRNSAGGSCILAMDASNGKLLWTFDASVAPLSVTFGGRPALHEGYLYASNGRLYALDAVTGELVSYSSDERVEHSSGTNVHIYKGQVVVWGQNLTLFEPVQ